ncbi:hypothetical protein LTR62_002574 [Meristemomyces frigidus]|uniref:Uncharacterized protein n=1 Tax=Meristemomyces frigidus TaxID=1508187 RepID=A0AAN7TFZ8_9PEZI|nr:hypothetical protein LTR62_002574 [Meristemomyces frigidus]
MSLTIDKLNDDTTFLLAFAPSFAPKSTKAGRKFPGASTILLDPWLGGDAPILHPTFQVSRHTGSSIITSLTELDPPPDVVVISQDKPDHCHQPTLCSLPKDTRTRILATPGAAKTIRGWKYFDHGIVHVMKPYNPHKASVVTRIRLEPYSSTSSAGEITIANIPTRRDITGLHNAIGITYRPPGSLLSAFGGDETVSLSDLSTTPDAARTLRKARSAANISNATNKSRTYSLRDRSDSAARPTYLDPVGNREGTTLVTELPFSELQRVDSKTSQITRHHREKTLSVIYTPHGLPLSTLKDYLAHHLQCVGAYPVTALFHCMNTEENPWCLGGMVANGAPGGVEVASSLEAKHWIGTHDEIKELKGVATLWLKSRRYSVEEVMGMLWERESRRDVKRRHGTAVKIMGCGERFRIAG